MFYEDLGIRDVWENWVINTLGLCLKAHKNLSKDCSSTFHINWGITLVPRTSYAKVIWGFSYTFLTGILALGKSEKTGPGYPKIVCRATQKKSKPSPTHFTSSKALLYYQSSLRVELYLFHRYLGMRKIWGKWTKRP